MLTGIPLLRRIYEVEVSEPFDLMIVSAGGHPKDINLYQGQKALGHASRVTREGGTVILATACPEGTGSRAYEEWILTPGMTSHAAVLERYYREGYRIGPHKAWQISRDASRMRVLFLSDMAPDFVRRLLLEPVVDMADALALALPGLPATARIGIMPIANATIPVLAPVSLNYELGMTN
jgi:nickel-dependent lactate racemase